ncbi:MAG: DUF4349 domain-containing protein [Chlorobi bacterium]|nr:DUF4349 domain-containing protein [Chlorobiota bacterium]MCI0716388.1 DUF4349 domain-containing protein [Chlorobiota bacterium]
MKYAKTLALAYIIPFIVAFNGCGNSDKQTSGDKRVITTDMESSPPQTIEDLALLKVDEKVSQNESDGNIQQINYRQQTENYNLQDKRMIIRSGTMSIESDNFNETEAKVKQIVNGLNGYVTNSSSQLNASGKKQGAITIRVAADRFDALLEELAKIGKVMNQNINGRDVTEEYMDSEARLKTQGELESRLLRLLAEKTANLTSIVEVEQKLAQVRENIEKTEGRMRFLKDQAAFSTLTVSVYEPAILNTSSGGGFFHEIGQGVKRGLTGFTSVVSGIITFVIALSPVLAIAGIILFIVVRILKKRKLAKA